ncbi:MAG TPA: hypothetical protein VKB62_10955 [Streptosporangiaceae bacterium]|nr:hypothetical protein [Streptosporangiaceae bacterium]
MSSPAEADLRPPRSVAAAVDRVRQADSIWWLAFVATAFTAALLALVVPRLGLSWDETVYISQVSSHTPAAYFDPARARGIPLLVAPVTMLTSSVLAVRIYLAVASGVALFLALLCWRGLRPAWQLALAGVLFGGLWTTLYYGPQAMPDLWVAFSSLAAVGLFLQAAGPDATRTAAPAADAAPQVRSTRWGVLAGLTVCVAIAALVRPGDALYLAAALGIAVIAVRRWRRWQLLAAVVIGFAAGAADWIIEAYVRFGSALNRLHEAGAEQGGFGFHFAVWDELRSVNGPTLCRPCTVGLRYPELSLWWLALPVLVVLGAFAAHRAGRLASSVLASACGLSLAFQYLFLINYAAPRFLLPAYALAAIPAADAIGGLLTGIQRNLRGPAALLVAVVLGIQLLIQMTVLEHQVVEKVSFFGDYNRIAGDLRSLGIRPPCLVKGKQNIPVAFYAGCASAPAVATGQKSNEPVVVLVSPGQPPPEYARGWILHSLPGIRSQLLEVNAYLAPRGS